MIWFRVYSEPLRQFYADEAVREFLDASAAKHRLLSSAGDLRSATQGETPNVTAHLDNTDGECTALFAEDPPIGCYCEEMDDDEVIFAGTINRVILDETTCDLEIDA